MVNNSTNINKTNNHLSPVIKFVSDLRHVGVQQDVQHYVIKFVSDLRHVGDFFGYSFNKTDRHDVAEILLKVALNTISQTKPVYFAMAPNLLYGIICTLPNFILTIGSHFKS
jgi:hypothetical protein